MVSSRRIAQTLAAALALAVLAGGLSACVIVQGTPPTASSSKNDEDSSKDTINKVATFMKYEESENRSSLEPPPERGEGGFRGDPPTRRTGYVYVRLDDGTKVKALCGVGDLVEGDAVDVEHRNGTWTVMGRAEQ